MTVTTDTEFLTDDYTAPSFKPGERYRFLYPSAYKHDDCGYIAHSGAIVTILRPLSHPEEYENQGDPAYKVQADDGWIGKFVWESELHALDYPWPNHVDRHGNLVYR